MLYILTKEKNVKKKKTKTKLHITKMGKIVWLFVKWC